MKYFPTVGAEKSVQKCRDGTETTVSERMRTGRNLQLRFEQMKIASRKGCAEVQRRN